MWIKDGKASPGWIILNVATEDEEEKLMKCVNPTPEQYRAAGWTWTEPPAPEPVDTTAFDAACEQFRAVCAAIATAAELPDFRGGFDEMADFQQSAVYGTLQGLQLAMAWSAANELCKYEGAKIGLGQPEWWYKCWEVEAPDEG